MAGAAGRHVPRVSLGGSVQPSATPERGRRPRRDCHQLHPEPASGVWGLSLSVLTAGKAKGKSGSTAPQPLAGWTFSPCFATGNVFLCLYLRVVHPDMLGRYSAAAPGGAARGKGCGGHAWGARGHGLTSMDAAPSSPRHVQSISTAPVTDRLGASASERAADGLTPPCMWLNGFVRTGSHTA